MKHEISLPFRRLLPVLMSVTIGITVAASGFAEDALTQGKRFLLNNQPDKAVPLFHKAVAEGNANPIISLYLGVCYIRLGKYAEAEQQLMNGKDKAGDHAYLYYYNLGNIYFAQDRFEEAEKAYTAAIALRPAYSQAVLNRANTYVKTEQYSKALKDYTFYLNLEPSSSQKEVIEHMVSLLELEGREALTIQREPSAQKLAREAEEQAAQERYKKLQDEINAQLQSVDRVSSFSVGSDTTLDYSEVYNIE